LSLFLRNFYATVNGNVFLISFLGCSLLVYKNVIDKGWRCGSSGWALTYHAQGPEFKLQHRKKMTFAVH
jgi:hypothetical protein